MLENKNGTEMELELITQLWGQPGYFVKEIFIDRIIIVDVKREGYPTCPRCKQLHLISIKDRRMQEVEDLSVFGKRCYVRLWKDRIECECG